LAVPFDIPMLYRGDDLVVVDKPHFLATMPRGGHVAQTALVCLRRDLDRTDAPTNRGADGVDGADRLSAEIRQREVAVNGRFRFVAPSTTSR
jgi:23S rRNA-/tRNA-specific pseudouridylate synthase